MQIRFFPYFPLFLAVDGFLGWWEDQRSRCQLFMRSLRNNGSQRWDLDCLMHLCNNSILSPKCHCDHSNSLRWKKKTPMYFFGIYMYQISQTGTLCTCKHVCLFIVFTLTWTHAYTPQLGCFPGNIRWECSHCSPRTGILNPCSCQSSEWGCSRGACPVSSQCTDLAFC